MFSPGVWDGKVKITSEVVEFTADDIDELNGSWQPTGTSFVDAALI
jgi:hypothetical protein